jgi:hypothetical protein
VRSHRYLSRVQAQALRRLKSLKAVLGAPTPDLDRRTAYVVIEAHATWSSFCRSFFLATAYGGRDASGSHVLPRRAWLASEDAAITVAVWAVDPSMRGKPGPWQARDEPRWHEAPDFRKAISSLGSTNAGTVSAALALAPSSLQQLTTFRNFYAHRGRETSRKAQNIARRHLMKPNRHPTKILNDYPPRRPQSLLAELIDEIDAVVSLLN